MNLDCQCTWTSRWNAGIATITSFLLNIVIRMPLGLYKKLQSLRAGFLEGGGNVTAWLQLSTACNNALQLLTAACSCLRPFTGTTCKTPNKLEGVKRFWILLLYMTA